LRRPDFRQLFAGLFFSMTAESILLLALAIWVKDLTGSNGLAGAAIFAVVAPIVFAPLLGFMVDRFRRKPFLVVVLLLSVVLLVPLLFVHRRADLWIIYAVAFGYGMSVILVNAALNGLIKLAGAARRRLMQTVKQGLRLVAPLMLRRRKGWPLPWPASRLGDRRDEGAWTRRDATRSRLRHLTGTISLRHAVIRRDPRLQLQRSASSP
jgi:hypothetical protein